MIQEKTRPPLPVKKTQKGLFKSRHNLSVLELVVNDHIEENPSNTQPFADIIFVFFHHALETTIDLIEAFIFLGANPLNLFSITKSYSNCKSVINKIKKIGINSQQTFNKDLDHEIFWREMQKHLERNPKINKIILLDRSALGRKKAMEYIKEIRRPIKIIAIEQTTQGFYHKTPFNQPVLDLARSATKKHLEAPLIAEIIVKKISSVINDEKKNGNIRLGVVGCGSIGQALADLLADLGHKVSTYDIIPEKNKNKKNIIAEKSLADLLNKANYILGCTGKDITNNKTSLFLSFNEEKNYISCSSDDVEFRTLIKKTKNKITNNTIIPESNKNVRILNQGLPINFDSTGVSVPNKDIQITRSLALSAALQAAKTLDQKEDMKKNTIPLSSYYQKKIAENWIKIKKEKTNQMTENFKDQKWIEANS